MLALWRFFSRACQIRFSLLLSLWIFTWTSSSCWIFISSIFQNWLRFWFWHSSKPRVLGKRFFSHIVWSTRIIEQTHIIILCLNSWLDLRGLSQVWLNSLCIAVLLLSFWLLSSNFISFSFEIISLGWSENNAFRDCFTFKYIASWKLRGWGDGNSRIMIKQFASFNLWFLEEVGLIFNQVSNLNRCVLVWFDFIGVFLQSLKFG